MEIGHNKIIINKVEIILSNKQIGGNIMQNNNEQEKKERQLDNLTNLVENHTRTKRHLEQYSEIGDPEFKEMAREKQEKREENMYKLKQEILDEDEKQTIEEQIENLHDNYEAAQRYIEANQDTMAPQDLQNLQEKQQHRKEQMENL